MDLLPLAAIAAATLVSEDLTSLGVAVLVAEGTVPAVPSVLACIAGIAGGDLLVWALGRHLGSRVLAWPRVAAALERRGAVRWRDALTRHVGVAVLASRVVPGTRVALYAWAGASGVPLVRMAGWTLVAATLWVPAIVIGVVTLGRTFDEVPRLAGRAGWMVVGLLWTAQLVSRHSGDWRRRLAHTRARIALALARTRHWEFWPMWAFYPPLVPWVAWLALRHGGFATLLATNPGLEDGGLVGESKHRILEQLPARWTLAACVVPAGGDAVARVADGLQAVRSRGWAYPIVAKPDVGQRGLGVRRVDGDADLAAYLAATTGAVLLQVWHPGPYEAGVFYARRPGEARGRVLSITDKVFPRLTGDGRSTVAALIARHPRFRFQGATFRARLGAAADEVPNDGAVVCLGQVGNHAQGTMFLDGRRLWTPALEARIDEIARAIPGFHFGRFDVRYTDPDAFMAGDDLAIVELNGVTSEATHLYDPSHSLRTAYRILFAQWRLAFEIGAANRAAGARVATGRVPRLVWRHLVDRAAWPVSS